MTTRVQKGGPVFRPIVKSRSRVVTGDNRQSSIVPDGGGDNSLSTNPTFARVPEFSSPGASNLPPTPETSSSASRLHTVNPNVVASTSASSHTSSFAVHQQPAVPILTPTGPSSRLPSNQPVLVDTRASSLQSAFVALTQSSCPLDPSENELRSLPSHNTTEDISHSLNAGVAVEPPASIPTTSASIISFSEAQTGGANLPLPPPKHMKRKRKTATSPDAEGSDEEADISANKSNRRASSGAPRARKSRPPSLPPFDADADPGEEIDPTVVTMASLCDDTGQGRVSRKAIEILTNHAAWKAQNREKRARMKTLMEQKKYGREETDDADDSNQTSGEAESTGSHILKSSNPASTSAAPLDDTGGEFDYSQDLASSRFNVQVRIGPNGETIIDEESLVVDRAEVEDTENYTHVVESDNTKFINSGSYGKRFRGSRWSAEETESFYDALSQYGENYELIAYVLPGRDRKSCKNKFKAEDKKNPARINYCLRNSIPVDMEALSRMTGKDFSGPVPEIRAPPPRPNVEANTTISIADKDERPPRPTSKRSSNKKKAADDGVVIIGEVGRAEDE